MPMLQASCDGSHKVAEAAFAPDAKMSRPAVHGTVSADFVHMLGSN